MIFSLFLSAILTSLSEGGMDFKLEAETTKLDSARSLFIMVTLKTAPTVNVEMPDLQSRFQGFSLAEDFEEEPAVADDGSRIRIVNWKLIPDVCAKFYRIAPFAVGGRVVGPVYFEAPDAREAVTGEMECEVEKDLPPLSLKLVGYIVLTLVVVAAIIFGLWLLVRLVIRKVEEHRMSPVERAWVELDRLLKKELPIRGKYKDFYVELTLVVRRYIQRQHGVRAPHLTTEEFFEIARNTASFNQEGLSALIEFLSKADMIKFAGVEATLTTAEAATDSAKDYIRKDSAEK